MAPHAGPSPDHGRTMVSSSQLSPDHGQTMTNPSRDLRPLSGNAMTFQAIEEGTILTRPSVTNSDYWQLHREIMTKFGQVSLLLPWMPPEVINWEGSWLVRVVSHLMAALLADGKKKCEILPQSVWAS